MEACFSACFRRESAGHEARGVHEFVDKAVKEILEARVMRGDCRSLLGATPRPGEDEELRVCVNIPGLNRAASQELFCPSHVGRCEGPLTAMSACPFVC